MLRISGKRRLALQAGVAECAEGRFERFLSGPTGWLEGRHASACADFPRWGRR
jgi:hypothetical protein